MSDDIPKCDKCGVELFTGLMAALCPLKEQCEFWPDDEESQDFLRALRPVEVRL